MNKVKKKVFLYFILCMLGCFMAEGIVLCILDAWAMALGEANDNLALLPR